jgi:hypothetical protein
LLAVLVFAPAAAQSGQAGAPPIGRPSDDAAAAPAGGGWSDDLRSTMNRVFGPGRWRSTSGYRSPAEENRLRLQGAGTVPPGRVSRHSLGSPTAPGAYDAIVYGLSPSQAAARLRRFGGGAFRVLAEAAHGPQGPHLHIEPVGLRTGEPPAKAAVACDTIYVRIIRGRPNPLLASCSAASSD